MNNDGATKKLLANENRLLIDTNATPKSPISANSYLGQLSQVMEDVQVRNFFKSYFSTWEDARPTMMLLQTFLAIDEAYAQECNGKRLPSEKIVAIVREMMANSECRELLAKAMTEFSSYPHQKFIEAYQKVALQKQITTNSLDKF